MLNEQALQTVLEGCRKGDGTAQKQFYQHFFGYAMNICLRYVASKDEAGEIMNDGFLKVFTKIHTQEKPGAIKSWLRRIMVNTAIDHIRKNQKYYLQDSISESLDVSHPEDIIADLSAEDILKMVQQLPPSYRMVFNMYVVEGYAHKEIAQKLDITPGASRSLLSAANARLRKLIEKNFYPVKNR